MQKDQLNSVQSLRAQCLWSFPGPIPERALEGLGIAVPDEVGDLLVVRVALYQIADRQIFSRVVQQRLERDLFVVQAPETCASAPCNKERKSENNATDDPPSNDARGACPHARHRARCRSASASPARARCEHPRSRRSGRLRPVSRPRRSQRPALWRGRDRAVHGHNVAAGPGYLRGSAAHPEVWLLGHGRERTDAALGTLQAGQETRPLARLLMVPARRRAPCRGLLGARGLPGIRHI